MKILTTFILITIIVLCSCNQKKKKGNINSVYITGCDSIFYDEDGSLNIKQIKGSRKNDSIFIKNIIEQNIGSKNIILIKPFGGSCGGIAETTTNLNQIFASKGIKAFLTMPDSAEEKIFNDISLEKAMLALTGGIKLNIPQEENPGVDTLKLKAKATMTFIMAANELYFYTGNFNNQLLKTNYSDVNRIIKDFKSKANSADLMFLIKSDKNTQFRKTITLLDAMTTSKVPAGHYAEIELTKNEELYLNKMATK
jgi:biopolymer transport protein ExbD